MTLTQSLPRAGKYLTFAVAQERYSVPVLKVREIMRLCPVTPVPRMPAYIKGVINLRGKIVPVVDLRERFGLGAAEDTERICIVVVQVEEPDGASRLTGMIVDVVEEVSQFQSDDLEPPPDFGDAVDARFIVGMAKTRGQVKTLLDIDRLLGFVGQIDVRALHTRSAEL
ncbi:chemotaxis protein CheW [Limnohabitans sp.]|jgi:purine-binding chemotaxis protein CheW|uniref:chemotaxis protein CheW n=1 Tax=Limnohabitans sp. TaxID=1907725 RepID=UPI0037BEF093